ncbi:hypothetical protein D9611_013145 [Ephemerocybe angulata]|uniref:C2H2-type domain-containing protein n=1 Tax=Ephemerocybe angulata TaxID=980116 RepID=A0A8H5FBU0_9AGAR|nr:hypothetical protein D9611_013145 [Tulosesus angulatus]
MRKGAKLDVEWDKGRTKSDEPEESRVKLPTSTTLDARPFGDFSMALLECPLASQGCSKRFKHRGALTNHFRMYHRNPNLVPPSSRSRSPSPEGSPPPDEPIPLQDANNTQEEQPQQETVPTPNLKNKTYHYKLTGIPTDEYGDPLPPGTPPPPRTDDLDADEQDWFPFSGESEFRLADFLYRDEEMSASKINHLLEIWALDKSKQDAFAPFASYQQMYETIDAIEFGDAPWKSFSLTSADGTGDPNEPTWKNTSYTVWYRDLSVVVRNLLDNPDFHGQFDYAAYVELDKNGKRRWSDFMLGNFAWRRSTQIYEEDETMEVAMLCPIILGSDKTTVSAATGHVEYHPLYLSIGNVHNTIRRAHRNAVVPIGFLAIPKGDRQFDNDAAFRKFKRQLYHASISRILSPLKKGMSSPVVLRCPDGHYRRVDFELAAFIADYPEQVLLAGTVQNWCTCHSYTANLMEKLDGETLWDAYGIDNDILPFTNDFPRADIHEILTPDLLHQVIKGTFKDHLVTWVGEYLVLEHGQKKANKILDDIDRRIAAAPSFPGLRRFPHGRRFTQWTGDDSKALMKVYLPAIKGQVPDEMVMAISAFLDVCYLARRSDITENTLKLFDKALDRFHLHREEFRRSGVRPTGFSLPRQHALSHYHHLIEEFGAPGGICSSITESRHITAVKKPWRCSNRYEALGQMLLTNQRLDKLAAARVEFVRRGLLNPSRMVPLSVGDAVKGGQVFKESEGDWEAVVDDVEFVEGNVQLARQRVRGSMYSSKLSALAHKINEPALVSMTRRFLHGQQPHADSDSEDASDNRLRPATDTPLADCPDITSRIHVYHSAVATFYAPSDESEWLWII